MPPAVTCALSKPSVPVRVSVKSFAAHGGIKRVRAEGRKLRGGVKARVFDEHTPEAVMQHPREHLPAGRSGRARQRAKHICATADPS